MKNQPITHPVANQLPEGYFLSESKDYYQTEQQKELDKQLRSTYDELNNLRDKKTTNLLADAELRQIRRQTRRLEEQKAELTAQYKSMPQVIRSSTALKARQQEDLTRYIERRRETIEEFKEGFSKAPNHLSDYIDRDFEELATAEVQLEFYELIQNLFETMNYRTILVDGLNFIEQEIQQMIQHSILNSRGSNPVRSEYNRIAGSIYARFLGGDVFGTTVLSDLRKDYELALEGLIHFDD